MRIYQPDEESSVLYHLHIPKTAGTTVYAMLFSKFASHRVAAVSPLELACLDPVILNQIDLFGGHLEFGYYLPQLLERQVQTVVILREPSKVLLSMYKQVIQTAYDPIHKYVMENCPDIERFFFDPYVAEYVRNPQTRYLGLAERRFTPDTLALLRAASTEEEIAEIVLNVHVANSNMSSDQIFSWAMNRLNACDVVGLVERLSESMSQICRLRGWCEFARMESLNVSSSELKPTWKISRSLSKRIEQLCEQDSEIYAIATKVFNKARAAACRRFFTFRRAA